MRKQLKKNDIIVASVSEMGNIVPNKWIKNIVFEVTYNKSMCF